jgi:hypothetical protein
VLPSEQHREKNMLYALIAFLIGVGTALIFVQNFLVSALGWVMLIVGIIIVVLAFVADRIFFKQNQ